MYGSREIFFLFDKMSIEGKKVVLIKSQKKKKTKTKVSINVNKIWTDVWRWNVNLEEKTYRCLNVDLFQVFFFFSLRMKSCVRWLNSFTELTFLLFLSEWMLFNCRLFSFSYSLTIICTSLSSTLCARSDCPVILLFTTFNLINQQISSDEIN